MTRYPLDPALEDVLESFAMELDHGESTLEVYLRGFPEYAVEILDFSRELARPVSTAVDSLSADDENLIDEALARHLNSSTLARNPFSNLAVGRLREIARELEVPRQILSAFRDRAVVGATVPAGFLRRLATMLGIAFDQLTSFVNSRPEGLAARSYKSDEKPSGRQPVTFERLLIDAGVSVETRSKLLKGDERD